MEIRRLGVFPSVCARSVPAKALELTKSTDFPARKLRPSTLSASSSIIIFCSGSATVKTVSKINSLSVFSFAFAEELLIPFGEICKRRLVVNKNFNCLALI